MAQGGILRHTTDCCLTGACEVMRDPDWTKWYDDTKEASVRNHKSGKPRDELNMAFAAAAFFNPYPEKDKKDNVGRLFGIERVQFMTTLGRVVSVPGNDSTYMYQDCREIATSVTPFFKDSSLNSLCNGFGIFWETCE